MEHCVTKIREIVSRGRDDRRSVFQLGYNLGRLSELTGLGRGPFWDAWKGAVEAWDKPELERLALDLLSLTSMAQSHTTDSDRPSGVDPSNTLTNPHSLELEN